MAAIVVLSGMLAALCLFVACLTVCENQDIGDKLKACRADLEAAQKTHTERSVTLAKSYCKLDSDYTALKTTHNDLLESIHQAIRDATP